MPRTSTFGLVHAHRSVLAWARGGGGFRRARPGSVLILVVALLVIIALAGTALITTARTDRTATQLNSANVQVDLLLDSVVRMVKSEIVNDLFDRGNRFRPVGAEPPVAYTADAGDYAHIDWAVNDRFLSSRAPEALPGGFGWFTISEPPLAGARFESPKRVPAGSIYDARFRMVPTSVLDGAGHARPAFEFDTAGTDLTQYWQLARATHFGPFLAADADGDGIADAGLWRLPIGDYGGLTYFVATRVVDNGSAVNLNTAWKVNAEFLNSAASPPQLPGDFFPSNIDLQGLLIGGPAEMARLNQFRFNASFNAASWTPAGNPPRNYDGTQRSDFQWTSYYDQLFHNLGRRIDNPAWRSANARDMKAFGPADATALASRYLIRDPNGQPEFERQMPQTFASATLRTTPYNPDEFARWRTDNFQYDNTVDYNRRPLTTVRSPVSNVERRSTTRPSSGEVWTATPDTQPNRMPYAGSGEQSGIVPRASLNTASFGELWKAFWLTMRPPTGAFSNPYATNIFRSSLRDPSPTPTVSFDLDNQMLLRAALAAVNAEDIRDSDDDVSSRRITLQSSIGEVDVTVFGTETPIFITEVYVNNDNTAPLNSPATGDGQQEANPKGYVAVELHNPNPVPVSLQHYHLGVLTRRNDGATPGPNDHPDMQLVPLTGFGGFSNVNPPVIPPNGYIVLENFNPAGAAGDDARHRPASAVATRAVANAYYVSGLDDVLRDPAAPQTQPGGELVLLRPRRSDGTYTAQEGEYYEYLGSQASAASGSVNLHQLVPLDSFDFSDFELAQGTTFTVMRYSRDTTVGKSGYPGTWQAGRYRQQGTLAATWDPNTPPAPTPPTPGLGDPWDPATPPGGVPGIAQPITLGSANVAPTYTPPFGPMQLYNNGFGQNKIVQPATGTGEPKNRFPFGGFARNGDALQVPFVGAYTIRRKSNVDPEAQKLPQYQNGTLSPPTDASWTRLVEINPITQDLARADDQDSSNDNDEQIGRFCPLQAVDHVAYPSTSDSYYWAMDLFDYVSVHAPHDDYTPNTKPTGDHRAYYGTADGSYIVGDQFYTPRSATDRSGYRPVTPAPQATPNDAGRNAANANGGREDSTPIEGLINLNTAPWRVLATLPLIPPSADGNSNGIPDNYELDSNANGVPDVNEVAAKAIVAYRDGLRDVTTNDVVEPKPFFSIFDLNKVELPGDRTKTFQNGFGMVGFDPRSSNPGLAEGDISPLNGGGEGIAGDFEARFAMMNRISNLVTTRSDLFTCYVVVQGWRNAGTDNPELVTERRVAFLLDRSRVNAGSRDATPLLVPAN